MSDAWTLRPYVSDDEGCVVPMWLRALCRSQDARAHADKSTREAGSDAQVSFWAVHQPIVTALVRGADVVVACDPERTLYVEGAPSVIWGWACTLGDVVLGVGIKRRVKEAGFGRDIARDMLGDRLDRQQTRVMDLPDLEGLRLVPETWTRTPGWLSSLRWLSERVIQHDALYQTVAGFVLDPARERWQPGTSRRAA